MHSLLCRATLTTPDFASDLEAKLGAARDADVLLADLAQHV